MELKITADKKLIEALERIAAAFEGCIVAAGAQKAAVAVQEPQAPATPAKPKEEPAPVPEAVRADPAPLEDTKPEAAPVPSRDDVQRLAIKMIQAGKREGVRAAVEKHGGTRVGDVPDANLVAFVADLEALA